MTDTAIDLDIPRVDVRRTFEITDLDVSRADGDHREITAYAAVFDTPAEVRDQDGHYWETIDRAAFDKTIRQRGDRIPVLFNHGLDLHGRPSTDWSMPIGKSIELKADGRGLLTRSRIAKTELGDQVLELARQHVITGFSFRGAPVGTRRNPVNGERGLPVLVRTEFMLREYGPGIMPVYEDAEILSVRTQHYIETLTDNEREELRRALADTPPGSSHEPPDPADPGHVEPIDSFRQQALAAVRRFDLKDI